MPFSDLLDMLAAIDSRGQSVIDTFSGSELSRAAGEVERLSALLATITDPARSGGIAAELEAAKEHLSLLESRRGSADSSAEGPAATPVDRVAFQMGRMRAEVEASTKVTEEVRVKVSKALAAILDPGSGESISGNFDKETGQFLGGALSFKRAREFVDRYNELIELQTTKLNAFEQYYVNSSIQQTSRQFAKEFGQLGDIKSLAKQLRDYLAATSRDNRATGPTSGTLGRDRVSAPPQSSLAVLRWAGRLR